LAILVVAKYGQWYENPEQHHQTNPNPNWFDRWLLVLGSGQRIEIV
jgi:hypothetical protein